MPENANPQSAAPNPSTATETLPASPPINPMSELFAGLEKLGVNGPEDKPAKSEPKKESAPKSPPSKSVPSAEKKSVKEKDGLPPESSKAESKSASPVQKPSDAPAKATEKPVPAPELRKAYEELKAKHKALEEEHKAWKTREDPEKKTLAEKAEAAAKRAKELEDKLRFTDYQSSDEYKEKYYKPFEEAYMSAVQKAASFKVTDAEGNTRQATKADFDRVIMAGQSGDEEAALNVAIEIFGETKAPFIMMQRDNVLTHNARMLKAVEDFKKTAGERSQAELAKNQERSKKMEALYQQHLAEAKEQFPHYFTEEEGDEEGNNLLKRGYSKYEAVFNGGHALDKDGNPIDLTDEQLVELHAEVFNKAAGFNRLAMKLTKASSRIKELEEELAQFQASEPRQGEGESEKEEGEPSWEQALESYAIR